MNVGIRMLDLCDFELLPESTSDFQTVDVFYFRTVLSWNIISQYLSETRSGLSESTVAVSEHNILPTVLDYLLSINVTSVNSERGFSKLKTIYNDKRHSLSDGNAGNELLLSSTVNSLNLDLSVEEIQDRGLKELLDRIL
ncbi:uncharacterized protein KNAG_0G00420 [Huiozyma naganishii CBS 8797]|uniref:HAT C-terminal dimerisation domain-containing protein n=1 Tax=Huiozyma naganishii (strain ATCC MYA-139 / BCRC 22969 / CBS 8797 / KCTC 17520 / NBRC 10181 / NCYC 3082 / Yp74L-3) TaxID=1071383 RepID=J7S7Q3_HUIN7|nr:hypothetical protein KNAG_0G00420 [Kazachstania naganishii CBS 8797]CCK71099.1 hypothetical protein KNAG_0G00420 [Kazachstania naganishii CBS 8797]